jgi:hypothetical protein
MGKLIRTIFGSKDEQSQDRAVRECLSEFSKSGSFSVAQRLRHIAFPTSQFAGSLLLPNNRWIAEIRYDHLLHEGEGETEAAALVDAISRMLEVTKQSSRCS